MCSAAGFKDKLEFIGLKDDYIKFMNKNGYELNESILNIDSSCIPTFQASEVVCSLSHQDIKQESDEIA